jgi:hypothetical protein
MRSLIPKHLRDITPFSRRWYRLSDRAFRKAMAKHYPGRLYPNVAVRKHHQLNSEKEKVK